eukprot:gene1435-1809_t
MRLGIVSSLNGGTGNSILAYRLKEYLESSSLEIELIDSNNQNNISENQRLLQSYDLLFCIHAYRAGLLVYNLNIPFILIFGGTDLNEAYKNEDKMKIMSIVVDKALKLVFLSKEMEEKALNLWSNDRIIHKSVIISPSISIPPQNENTNSIKQLLQSELLKPKLSSSHSNNFRVYLMPSGIRKIKDPLFLLTEFSNWSIQQQKQQQQQSILIIVGPCLDEKLCNELEDMVGNLKNVYYHPSIPYRYMLNCIRDCFALVNSSINEGLCTCIIEAMALDTPVIARNNGGNSRMLLNGDLGLLFDTPQQFIQCCQRLEHDDNELRSNLIIKAKQQFNQTYSVDLEIKKYLGIINNFKK